MADQRIGTDFGAYRIVDLVGRGGMGVVYVAEHSMLRRRSALKVIAPELADDPVFRERFVDESRLAATIDHPNIVPIYEAGEAAGALFIAMRLIDGTDLRTILHEEGPLEPGRAVDIIAPVADALDAAHAVGLVHRDVKSANILVERRTGRPFLTDFGVTKLTSSTSGLTRTGQLVGTPGYMAPEQITGGPVDGRADQYALACVLFEAVTGHVPHERDSELASLFARVNLDPPDVREHRPEVPVTLADALRRGLAKEPADRFPTCAGFAAAARAAIDDARAVTEPIAIAALAADTPPPPMPTEPGSNGPAGRGGRRPLVAALAAVGITALLGIGALAAGIGRPTPTATPPATEPLPTSLGTPVAPSPTAGTPSSEPSASGLPSSSPLPSTVPSATIVGPSPTPTRRPSPTPTKAPTPVPTVADTVDPIVEGPPTHKFVAGTRAVLPYKIPVRVAWDGSDAGGSGIKEYVVERRQSTTEGGGSWTEVYRGTAKNRTFTLDSRISNSAVWYTFRVKAVDKAGNASTPATGSNFLLYDYEESNGAWTYSGGWSSANVSGAIEGEVRSCSTAGETATLRLSNVSNMAFVFTTGSGFGSVQITVNGSNLGTFDLSTGPGTRTVVAVRSPGSATQAFFDTVITTQSGQEVQLDAVFVQHGEPT